MQDWMLDLGSSDVQIAVTKVSKWALMGVAQKV
jgi:hypothetical protein